MPRFDDVVKKLNNLPVKVSRSKESEICTLLLQIIEANIPGDTQNDLSRHRAEPLQATRQADNKLSDQTLMKMVTSFFHNDLFNILQSVPEVDDDQVWKHVQKVAMAMHKQVCNYIWGNIVDPKLRSGQVKSVLVKEFLPTITLQAPNPTEADCMNAFEDCFRKVHCSAEEPHPPADMRTSLSTRNSVLRVKEEALKEHNMNSEKLHQLLSATFQQECKEKLKYLKEFIGDKQLTDLSSQICSVVSAMLLHSSPIIPFTGQPQFFSAYHEPTRYAREDPNGRSVLLYRTPYLYFYHYGELKTVLRASVTFEIPPETSAVSSPRPAMQKADLIKELKQFFSAEKLGFDCAKGKTEAFIGWYRFANNALTREMLQLKKVSQTDSNSLNVKRAELGYSHVKSNFIKAFKKRHKLLPEVPNLLASNGLSKTLRDHIQREIPRTLKSQEEIAEGARLVIALLCFHEPWIPFGFGDEKYFNLNFHFDVTKDYVPKDSVQRGCVNYGHQSNAKRLPQKTLIESYLEPLLWSPVTDEPLFLAKVILHCQY